MADMTFSLSSSGLNRRWTGRDQEGERVFLFELDMDLGQRAMVTF